MKNKVAVFLIKENNFHNAWAKAVQAVLKEGVDRVIGGLNEKGEIEEKPIKDARVLIWLTDKAIQQIEAQEIHPQFPFQNVGEYCKEFTIEFLEEYRRKPDREKFSYLYLERLVHFSRLEMGQMINQIKRLKFLLAEQIKDKITSNRCQAITWQPETDLGISSPPCLQRIQVRYLGDREVDIDLNWRSRDLFNAWQANIIAIIGILNREIIKPSNCSIVSISDYSVSLHIYKGDIGQAKEIKLVPVSPQEIRFD